MMFYDLAWSEHEHDPLPLVTRDQMNPVGEGIPVYDVTGVVMVVSLKLISVEDAPFARTLRYRIECNDVDGDDLERCLQSRQSLQSLTRIAHVVDERRAVPVSSVPLDDGRVVDMHADTWTGDMLETREVWSARGLGDGDGR